MTDGNILDPDGAAAYLDDWQKRIERKAADTRRAPEGRRPFPPDSHRNAGRAVDGRPSDSERMERQLRAE